MCCKYCNNNIYNKSSYCILHKCYICNNSYKCKKHYCNFKKYLCYRQKHELSKYCIFHKCNFCDNNFYCKKHIYTIVRKTDYWTIIYENFEYCKYYNCSSKICMNYYLDCPLHKFFIACNYCNGTKYNDNLKYMFIAYYSNGFIFACKLCNKNNYTNIKYPEICSKYPYARFFLKYRKLLLDKRAICNNILLYLI